MSPDIRHLAEQLEKFCLTDDINKLCRLEEVLPPNRPIADPKGLDWPIFKYNILCYEPSPQPPVLPPPPPAPLVKPNNSTELFTKFFISAGVCVLGMLVLSAGQAGQIGEAAPLIALGTGVAGLIAVMYLIAALTSSGK